MDDVDGSYSSDPESSQDSVARELRDVRIQVALARARLEAIASLADRLSGLEARMDRFDAWRETQAANCSRGEAERLAARLEALEKRFAACFPQLDMRREPRHAFDENVQVTIMGECDRPAAGRVVDVSDKGLGLVVGAKVPVGAEVEVDLNEVLVRGRVVHCRGEGEHFAIGVSLEQPMSQLLSN